MKNIFMIFLMCSSFAILADFKPWKLASDYNTLLQSSSNKDLTTEDTLNSHNQFPASRDKYQR